MSSTRPSHLGSLAALAAGLAWSTLSLLSLAEPDPEAHLDVIMLLPLTLSIGGVSAVYLAQRHVFGRLGRLGFGVSIGSLALLVAGQACHVADLEMARNILIVPGIAGWIIGFALLGVATARAGILPVWSGVILALSEPLTILAGIALSPISPLSDFGDYSGAIMHGLIWLSLGIVLRSRSVSDVRRAALNAT